MGKGQCYKVVTSASLLTISKLVVKTEFLLEIDLDTKEQYSTPLRIDLGLLCRGLARDPCKIYT
jgi:hypothetical protein